MTNLIDNNINFVRTCICRINDFNINNDNQTKSNCYVIPVVMVDMSVVVMVEK